MGGGRLIGIFVCTLVFYNTGAGGVIKTGGVSRGFPGVVGGVVHDTHTALINEPSVHQKI